MNLNLNKLRELADNKKLYRNHGTKNLARVLLDIFDGERQGETKEAEVIVVPVPVPEPVPEPVPVICIPEAVEIPEPVETIVEEEAKDEDSEESDIDLSTDYVSDACVSKTKQEEEENTDLVRIGSYDYNLEKCKACNEMRAEHQRINVTENGVVVSRYNYFEVTCKPCTKKRFESWRVKKQDEKCLKKALTKNVIRKSEVKTVDDKVDELRKLKDIRKEKPNTNKEQTKKDIKNGVATSSSFNLQLFV
jgi:hypothetical protein